MSQKEREGGEERERDSAGGSGRVSRVCQNKLRAAAGKSLDRAAAAISQTPQSLMLLPHVLFVATTL